MFHRLLCSQDLGIRGLSFGGASIVFIPKGCYVEAVYPVHFDLISDIQGFLGVCGWVYVYEVQYVDLHIV